MTGMIMIINVIIVRQLIMIKLLEMKHQTTEDNCNRDTTTIFY